MPDLAADPVDAMLIDVRANTRGFAEDVARMRQDLDGELVAGFSRAGEALERSLLRAIRRGSLGFEDLQASASKAIDRIASQALKLGIGQIFGANNPLDGARGSDRRQWRRARPAGPCDRRPGERAARLSGR